MTLTSQNIKLIAQKHLAGTDIDIIENNSLSPQQFLVAQYNEISKAFDTLDTQAFELGRDFLREIESQDANDITLKCLQIVNKSALEELQADDCEFLENHAEAQMQYGLDLHFTLIDAWECLGQEDRKAQALKNHFRTLKSFDHSDLSHMMQTFKSMDAADEQMSTQTHRLNRNNQNIRAAE